jgi:hypothetical protein
VKREACADWPRVLCPAPGCYPLASPRRTNERVLHLANSDHEETCSLGFDSIASKYRRIFWPGVADGELVDVCCTAAQEIRPTIVFVNIQADDILCPQDIDAIRACCDPSVVIVNWDGDQHFEPDSPAREWFVDLGKSCDASLVVNTEHPAVYARLGVRHPGFLEASATPSLYHPTTPALGIPSIIFLGSGSHKVHARRTDIIREVARVYGPDRFAAYGLGWNGMAWGHAILSPEELSPAYYSADASLSISARNDLPRYTSMRLFFMLCSGAVSVVESFPDSEGLGLVHGVNCLLWTGMEELRGCLRTALCMQEEERQAIRDAAVELGHDHTDPARMLELLAIVDAVRANR